MSDPERSGAPTARVAQLRELLGGVDIYLLDQLMKGRLAPGSRILDAGCGGGRNLEPLLRCGYDVYGIDASSRAVLQTSRLAQELGCDRPTGWASQQSVDALAFADSTFDTVVCCAVLHFATDPAHWDRIVDELWRVLVPKGLFIARLASSIGLEASIEPLGGGHFRLPDGTTRFLVDRDRLIETSARLGGTLIETLKTTVVDSMRAMTTWCLVKAPEVAA